MTTKLTEFDQMLSNSSSSGAFFSQITDLIRSHDLTPREIVLISMNTAEIPVQIFISALVDTFEEFVKLPLDSEDLLNFSKLLLATSMYKMSPFGMPVHPKYYSLFAQKKNISSLLFEKYGEPKSGGSWNVWNYELVRPVLDARSADGLYYFTLYQQRMKHVAHLFKTINPSRDLKHSGQAIDKETVEYLQISARAYMLAELIFSDKLEKNPYVTFNKLICTQFQKGIPYSDQYIDLAYIYAEDHLRFLSSQKNR